MKIKKNKKLLIIVLSLIIVGILGYIVYDKISSNEKDTFSLEDETGKAIVKGYIAIENISENLYDDGYEYVYFNIIESNSQNFLKYIENNSGNSFVLEKAIGIGCIESDSLNYVNDSDEYGMKSYSLSKEDTEKILATTKKRTVTLELEKLKLSNGGHAPNCYSHITNIKVVD